MDYLTIGLAVLTVIMIIVALILLYSAKTSTSDTTRNRNRNTPRLFGMYLSGDVVDELYNPNKINSAMASLWAALVFGAATGISASVKKTPLVTRGINAVQSRLRGFVPTSGLTLSPS